MSRHRQDIGQILKIKLIVLGIGILILGLLLFNRSLIKGNARGTEKSLETVASNERNEEEQEPVGEIREDEKDQEDAPAAAEEIIRVLIKTNGFAGEIHETIRLTAACDLQVEDRAGGIYEGGTELTFSREGENVILNGEVLAEKPECYSVRSSEEISGGITVASLERHQGTPSYEGVLEIWPVEGGFVLINELFLESYLCYVVPSEMPSGYRAEALKAQAVCARTYAYKHIQSYAYPEYEAHVDDSVRYQVYNNTGTAESTTQAVADTKGLILTWRGEPITAYYFSTSCGCTGDEELWWEGDAQATPYLRGKTLNEKGETLELNSEEAFAEFIQTEDDTCYDSDISWYRWETEIDVKTLSAHLNTVLKGRYQANPEAILTREGEDYQSISTESVGTIRSIEVLERNIGGAVQKIRVNGSKKTIIAETEYNVRALLNVQGCTISRNDGSTVEGSALLPSGCFMITPLKDETGKLTGFRFQGGGYGHGVGLSQNGANGMAKQGKSFEEILHFFYTDVELTELTAM